MVHVRIAYKSWRPRGSSAQLVDQAETICSEYAGQGYDLTLRQLYYQFVARGIIPNNQKQYKMLGNVIDNARQAGLLDWNYIVDRTRNLMGYQTYDDPGDLIAEQQYRYHRDLWEEQNIRPEVWVEKEALAGVVSRAALQMGVDYFSCRGYVSQSEMHSAALRHRRHSRQGQHTVILHLGDHDPSGIDMTRDIQDRLWFFGAATEVNRIALNFDQVEAYSPPPNPAKLTDSRVDGYIAQYGMESWELDALDPATLDALITENLQALLSDPAAFEYQKEREDNERDLLVQAGVHWSELVDTLNELQ